MFDDPSLVSFGGLPAVMALVERAGLARLSPILDGADQLTFVDVDDTIREARSCSQQGVAYGYSGVKGLNEQVATISTLTSAPVIAGTRSWKPNVAPAHGVVRLITDALATLRRATTPGQVIVRADCAYFTHQVIAAIRRGGASFSITARMKPAVVKAIATIDDQAWTPIRYPQAIWDEGQHGWISDVAEVRFTAFTSHRTSEQITCRLIVRRVTRLNDRATTQA